MQMKLQSVCGELSREALGTVTTHEHVLLDLTAFYQALPVPGIDDPETQKVEMWNLGILSRDCYALKDNLLLMDEEVQASEIAFFKRAGGDTVVDASLPGIGRDPEALRRIAEKTGLNIIMGTGFYVGQTHPEALSAMTEREIADIMVRELTVGVGDTGICAGYIGEIGISEIFDDRERRILRAAAIAQIDTGVAINIHINPWTVNGLEAADILLDAGVDPSRICISHIDVEDREDYVFALLKKGVYVEFDNFGKEYYIRREVRNSGYGCFVHDTERVTFLKKLIDAGYLRQVLLSCDVCLKNLLHTYGGWGYDHVLTNIVPMMEDEGITAEQIHTLLVTNPADWLMGKEK
ncbi:MAG: phosphotriesterase-related protein [Ruminococcaceae bacterium]|nr:phosphotriesterase-related protein [Oscillospiraceae bacterium]